MYQNLGTQEYRSNDVMGANPVHLIVMAYDVAINACEQKDFTRAVKSVTVMRDALNFEYAEVSTGLFRLYQWCLDCIRMEDYASAAKTLRELRQAWAVVEKRAMPTPPAYQSQSVMARA